MSFPFAASALGGMGMGMGIGLQTTNFPDNSHTVKDILYEVKEELSGDTEIIEVDGGRRGQRDDLETRIRHIESESARMSSENGVLKQLIMDSRLKQAIMQDKMERVLKTLYNVFMGGGNSNSLSISTNGSTGSMVPAPSRSSLAPQMLENLLFRLDSLQTYGLRSKKCAA